MIDAAVGAVAGVQRIAAAIVGPVLDFVDGRQIVRRAIVLIVLWQLVDAYLWAKGYAAAHPDKSGVELGAVIAAVTGPPTMLMGFLFRLYGEGRAQP